MVNWRLVQDIRSDCVAWLSALLVLCRVKRNDHRLLNTGSHTRPISGMFVRAQKPLHTNLQMLILFAAFALVLLTPFLPKYEEGLYLCCVLSYSFSPPKRG